MINGEYDNNTCVLLIWGYSRLTWSYGNAMTSDSTILVIEYADVTVHQTCAILNVLKLLPCNVLYKHSIISIHNVLIDVVVYDKTSYNGWRIFFITIIMSMVTTNMFRTWMTHLHRIKFKYFAQYPMYGDIAH